MAGCPSVRFSQVAPASVEYWYPVTADPPLLAGAVKETIRVWLAGTMPLAPVVMAGAPGVV